jgi:hypothetical protein
MDNNAGVPDSFTDRIIAEPSASGYNKATRASARCEQKVREFIEKNLSKRAQRFLYEYRRTSYNAAEAALLSNIAILPQAAHMLGTAELRKPHMARAIALMEELDAVRTDFIVERGKYMRKLDRIAMHNQADFLERDITTGEPRVIIPDPSERPELFDAIAEIKVRTTTKGRGENREQTSEVVLKPLDTLRAIELLFKLDNMEKERAAAKEYAAKEVTSETWQPVTFNIMPVPTGEFLPAPEPPPYQLQIVASA